MQDECPPPTKGQIDCAKKELTLCKEVYAGTQAKLNHWMQVSIKQCFLEAGLRDCYDLVCVLLQYDCLVADAWVKKKEAQIAAMEIACVTTTRDELLSAIFGRCGGCDEWTGPIGFYLQNAIYNVSH